MRPSEYLKDLLRDTRQFDPRAVAELGRWLDNVNGQTDVLSQTLNDGDAAPLNAPYLVAAATASLLFERVLTVAAPLTATDGGAHSNFELGITEATTLAAGSMSASDKTKLDGIEAGANLYVHPNHSGDVTSVGDGAQTITAGAVTLAKMAALPAMTVIGNDHATDTLTPQALTVTELLAMLLARGSMYADDISQAVTVSSANVYYEVPGSLTGGLCSGFTFQNNKELLCGTAGTYRATWGMSITSANNNENVSGAVMVNTTEAHNTEGSAQCVNATKPVHVSGSGDFTLSAGDVVKLCVQNEDAAHNITVYHATLTIARIG